MRERLSVRSFFFLAVSESESVHPTIARWLCDLCAGWNVRRQVDGFWDMSKSLTFVMDVSRFALVEKSQDRAYRERGCKLKALNASPSASREIVIRRRRNCVGF